MLNVLCSSPSASRQWFRFPFISLPAVSWLRSWRVIWLAFGLWFAWNSVGAELQMGRVYNGRLQPVADLLRQADSSVDRWPFDPYLRRLRQQVRDDIARIPPRPQ
jgi:hypothetical protein